ncbi:hypothetical protein BOTBODRAFT_250111 [Botryobasidium botryosum FD-172 SS1]|uniref:C2 domain-containing protein n=1 Tax=Botryobasidium botryosum (strain FD-172 SS1) TaxID=930990 RepID=A0A067MY68_BOTB1|nr:hypothetical protein BOTBODRAFT_250111 [Botryobasidium botryosum FD-172 SS1]
MVHSNEISETDATRSDVGEELKLTVVSANDLPQLSLFRKSFKALVTLRASGQTWSTRVSRRNGSPWWEEEFDFEQLVGTAEVRFEELRAKQRQAHEEDIDYVAFDLPVVTSEPSQPQPSISLRVHKGVTAPKPALAMALEARSSTQDNMQRLRMGPEVPTAPTGASDAASSARDAAKAVGSAKEVKELYDITLGSVKAFMEMVDDLAKIHPYANAAWKVLSAGYKIAVAQEERDDALCELLESMSTALDQVCRFNKVAKHKLDKDVIAQVAKKTNECALFIEKYCETKSFARRAVKNIFSNAGEEIARFKNDFDLLRKNLDTGAILSLTEGLSGVNEDIYKIGEGVKDIARNVERTARTAILDKLPYAAGASWSPKSGCLPGTREALVEEIMNWIRGTSASDGAEILCLTGVAGSGKSAIAHTVARRCREEGILASSFFFNREFEERHQPDKLLSTMARDLAARYPDIGSQLGLALEADQSLATASLSRQFAPLIAEPCRRHTFDHSIAFVLDALDEIKYPPDVLEIFRDDVPQLPQACRLFVTSRDMQHIDTHLLGSAHVCLRTINLDEGVNLGDLCTYIDWRCRDIAKKRGLGPSWPNQVLKDMVISKAQGLFQWAVTVFQALDCAYDPAGELEALLAGLQAGLSPEEKMDEIYSKILQAYNWNEHGFKRDYDLVMGVILAAKSPLSVSALQILHHGIPNINSLLSRLGALLTGWRDSNQPVRILHLSLRDFLTARALDSTPFHICEKDHSRRLGLLCLAFLNENLKHDTPGVGYLESDSPGIPTTSKSQVSEALWYACEFWTAHILEYNTPAPTELNEPLRSFLSARLILWMEVCTSIDTFKGFQQIKLWIESLFPEDISLMSDELDSRLAGALDDISERLSYMDRREEALLAIQEAVELRRRPMEGKSTTFNNDLASSLRDLSLRFFDVGRREDALAAILEAVNLHRKLANGRPAEFNLDLARSLNHLSNHLSALGQREDALAASQDSVGLYRQLTQDRPAVLNPDLALSLVNLSICLSDLGQREDALTIIREAVDLHRQLAQDRPTTFSPGLAKSLNNLSNHLSDLGQREDALAAIREAVELRRQLAHNRPATFNPVLASSLNNLSVCLSDLGQREDALEAIREAVELNRQLAQDRPAAFNPVLADSLNNLSNRLSDLGQQEDALAAIRGAVELRRQLARDRPAAFNPVLACSLNNLSCRLSDLGKLEDALAATREAVGLCRQLTQDSPAAFNPNLARYLYNLSIHLSALGYREEALAAAKEAVELYRPLAKEIPAVFKSRLVGSLRRLSQTLWKLGQKDDAVAAKQEADALDSPEASSDT